MHSRFVAVAVAALSLVFLACGGASSSGEAGQSDCRIKLSGATTAVFDCATSATLSWTSESPGAFLNVGVDAEDAARTGVLTATAQVHLPAPPELKSYQGTDAGVVALLNVAKDMEHYWTADLGRVGSTGGSVSITISSIGDEIDPVVGTHLVHGKLHATLTPAPGSSSTQDVVLDATF